MLKPHEDTPLSALELAKLAQEAGVPNGVFSVVTGAGETVGEALVKSPIPRLITFTGSVETGKQIMRTAADTVKVVSLEMGGKAPFIVMDDADLDSAVKTAVFSRFFNCGQVCICNERTYVHKRIAGRFISRFLEEVKQLKLGDPLEAGVQVGPKVSRQELEKVERFVEEARGGGAEVATGGKRPGGEQFSHGYWYEPTVITKVRQDMRIMQEEVFGPVIPIMEFNDFEEGLTFANDSRYGLAAYLFTNDMNRILRAVRDLECGEATSTAARENRSMDSTPAGSKVASVAMTESMVWSTISSGRPYTFITRAESGGHHDARLDRRSARRLDTIEAGASICDPRGRTC